MRCAGVRVKSSDWLKTATVITLPMKTGVGNLSANLTQGLKSKTIPTGIMIKKINISGQFCLLTA